MGVERNFVVCPDYKKPGILVSYCWKTIHAEAHAVELENYLLAWTSGLMRTKISLKQAILTIFDCLTKKPR